MIISVEKEVLLPDLEKRIIELRREGFTYRGIQTKLGNPSKKFIRKVLMENAPELAGDVVKNYGRKT